MSVNLSNGTKIDALICDTCSEDATPKKVREACDTRQKQIDEVMAQAKALGLDLAAISSPTQKIQVLSQAQQPQPLMPPRQQSVAQPVPVSPLPSGISPLIDDEEGPVISTAAILKPLRSVGGNINDPRWGSSNVPVHQSHGLDELGSSVLSGKAKVTMVEGRDGMPLQLPSIIQDGTGTTRLRIRQQMDDGTLQRKFKNLGMESRWDRGADFRTSYETETERPCPICKGSGTVKNFGRMVSCPKCNGVGIIIIT